jgi:opacity protein-like surface antigen
MRIGPAGIALAAVFLASSPPARAQSFGVDFEAGYRTLNASDSARALFASNGGLSLGGSAQYAFGSGLFVRAGGRYFTMEGEKVYLADAASTPYPLGFPLTLRITSIDLLGGWRFRLGGRRPSPFVPYVAAGVELASYEEESTVAGLAERSEVSNAGAQFLAGLEFTGFSKLSFAVEAGYALVPDAIGLGGVSRIYGEDDIGGLRVVGRVGFRFK